MPLLVFLVPPNRNPNNDIIKQKPIIIELILNKSTRKSFYMFHYIQRK